MPSLVAYRPLRLFCDLGNPNRVLDQRTGLPPVLTRGSATGLELALGLDGNVFTGTITGVAASITAQLRASADPGSTVYLEGSLSAGSINNTLTQSAWDARSAQHVVIPFTTAQCNIAAGTYWLVVWFTSPAGEKTIALAGFVTVVENGAGLGTTPDTIPAGYTTAQADARFLPLTPASGTFRIKTSSDGTFFQLKDSVTGLFCTVWFADGALQIGPGES